MTINPRDQQAKRLAAEAIRHIETAAGPLPGSDLVEQSVSLSHSGVEGRILERAAQLGEEAGIPGVLHRVKLITGRISAAGLAIAAILGGLAAGQAVAAEQQTINFYWLLLVLLGVNTATLCLWLGTMLIGRQRFTPGVFGNAFSTILKWVAKHHSGAQKQDYPAALAYAERQFGGPGGRWVVGSISHSFWSAYLVGGIALVILQFSTRQYDFVWETTLLPEAVFIQLTAWLSWLPQALGLEVPSTEQVLQSRPAADFAGLADARRAWATLLLASLLFYGLLPRLILAAVCSTVGKYKNGGAQLNLSHPYYVQLRQRLMPVSESLGVIDEEENPRYEIQSVTRPSSERLPSATARWVGVEIDPKNPWPPGDVDESRDLGVATDRDGQRRVLEQARRKEGPLVIAIPLARAADRGLSRLVGQLARIQPSLTWLALLENRQSENLTRNERSARTNAWYALAARHQIPADQVFHYRIGQSEASDSVQPDS